MLVTIISLVVGYFFTQFAGYFIHRFLHVPETGRVYLSHEHHHDELYPPHDFLSQTYRDPPLFDRPIWFYLPPAVLTIALLYIFLPVVTASIVSAEVLFIAWLNDWVHTAFHTRDHWLEQFKWFQRGRALHWWHHVQESRNFGVTSMLPDKLCNSYWKPLVLPLWVKAAHQPVCQEEATTQHVERQ